MFFHQLQLAAITVREQLAGKRAGTFDVDFEDLGAHSLKNIEEPIRVFAVGTSARGAVMVMRPPSGVNLMALESRLFRICCTLA